MIDTKKESAGNTKQLRERATAFYAKWRDRVESGWSDEKRDVRVLRIDSEHLDSEHDEYQYAHICLAFRYGSDGGKFFADFRLGVTEPQAKIVFYFGNGGWGEDSASLVLSYSESYGKSIQLRPREFDELGVTDADLNFAKWLLDEFTTDIGLIPEVPFDFTPIHTYVEKQQEVFEKTQELWGGLYPYWKAVAEAWDNHLLD